MCGIVGYCGPRVVSEVLIEGLRRLEYRGYDSSGIAVSDGGSGFEILKRVGKIRELAAAAGEGIDGMCGIGHTRWATHGGVTEANAHPHTDDTGAVVVVHNGIIENYGPLKSRLEHSGRVFASDTDTEVIAHLISESYEGDLEQAVLNVLPLLKGTYGIAVMHRDEPGLIVGARNGSPLVLGVGDQEMFIASDVTAILPYTKDAIYLNDGELVSVTKDGYRTFDIRNNSVPKRIEQINWEIEQIEKDGFAHFMEKEIYEQVESIKRAFSGRLNPDTASGHLGGLNMTPKQLHEIERVKIIAAGTSYYAGMIGAYLIEKIARIPATAETLVRGSLQESDRREELAVFRRIAVRRDCRYTLCHA